MMPALHASRSASAAEMNSPVSSPAALTPLGLTPGAAVEGVHELLDAMAPLRPAGALTFTRRT
jgi:hypothetical protein